MATGYNYGYAPSTVGGAREKFGRFADKVLLSGQGNYNPETGGYSNVATGAIGTGLAALGGAQFGPAVGRLGRMAANFGADKLNAALAKYREGKGGEQPERWGPNSSLGASSGPFAPPKWGAGNAPGNFDIPGATSGFEPRPDYGVFGPGSGANGASPGGAGPTGPDYGPAGSAMTPPPSLNGNVPFNDAPYTGLYGPSTNVQTGGGEAPSGGGENTGVQRGAGNPAMAGGFTGNRSGGTLGGGTAVNPSQWGQFGFGGSDTGSGGAGLGYQTAMLSGGRGAAESGGGAGFAGSPLAMAAALRARTGGGMRPSQIVPRTGGGMQPQMQQGNTGIVPPSMQPQMMVAALRRPPIKKIV